MNEAPQKRAGSRQEEEAVCPAAGKTPTHSNTTPGRALRWWSDTGYLSTSSVVGEWMRLMLLCCTWKDERMGEEEGEDGAEGLFVGERERERGESGGAGDAGGTGAHPLRRKKVAEDENALQHYFHV